MLNIKNISKLNWLKTNGIMPVVIQENISNEILMHGYMNQEALLKTQKDSVVTFYSRTKKRLWTKGETSGNFLKVIEINTDCDHDTLLISVSTTGNTCHLDNKSCFIKKKSPLMFLFELEQFLYKRKKKYKKDSYTSYLYQSGTKYIAQKVGEEAVETILAAMNKDKDELVNETSDLIYHLIVLLHDQDLNIGIILNNLQKRSLLKN